MKITYPLVNYLTLLSDIVSTGELRLSTEEEKCRKKNPFAPPKYKV